MLDPSRLGQLVRQRRSRLGWSLRRTAAETGVAFNTIARVEAGHIPDLDNYRKLAEWLGVGVASPAPEPEPSELPTPDAIVAHLHRDPALSAADAERIGRLVKDMYEALARPPRATAVHLRAATTFRPAAATLLGELLDDMKSALEADGTA